MEFVIVFSLLMTLVRSQDLKPFDFNIKENKSIWESPELQPVLAKINSDDNIEPAQTKIAGGNIATPDQFPHHVLLYLDSAYVCGGSLLNADWILTVRMFLLFNLLII